MRSTTRGLPIEPDLEASASEELHRVGRPGRHPARPRDHSRFTTGPRGQFTRELPAISAAIALTIFPLMPGLAASASANPLFAASFLSFDTAVYPLSVAIGDLNGDGSPDLVTACRPGSVSVLLGSGGAMFEARTDYATGSWPQSVAIADLNGDGRLDLVVANQGSISVSVLLGNGDGTFGPRSDYATASGGPAQNGMGPKCVAIGDLNGDARPDLAVAIYHYSSGTVSILLGNGDGTFGAHTDFGTDRVYSNSVAIADLNGDTTPDLAVAASNSAPGWVSVLLGIGDGTFGAATNLETGDGAVSAALGDLNGDTTPDLVVGTSTTSVSVRLGIGDGTFGAHTNFDAGHGGIVAIRDLNGNGILDLVVAAGGQISALLGNGEGTFGPHMDFETGGGGSGSVAIADLSGDGQLDLAVLAYSSVSVVLGHGDGTFGRSTDFRTGGAARFVAIGDMNGDGTQDIATANGGVYPDHNSTVSVLLGNGDGTFGAQTDLTEDGCASVAIGDLNRDGIADLAAAKRCDICSEVPVCAASVRLGIGGGTFGPNTTYATGIDPVYVAIGDLNGDGNPEVLTANHANYCVGKGAPGPNGSQSGSAIRWSCGGDFSNHF